MEQDSIEVAPVGNVNDTLSVVATWTTNLPAAEDDRLALSSPNGVPYESSLCSTCSDSTGRAHAVTLTVSCEPGWWKYTVSSRRDGCVQARKSDVDSFFVTPTVIASGSIVSTYPGVASYTCPRGDGVSRYVASVDFGCVAQIDSTRLTLEDLHMPIPNPNRKMAFFPQDTPQPADGPATSGNGYATTITERQIGGCNGDTASVFLDSIEIARLDVPSTPSVDLTGSVIAQILGQAAESEYSVSMRLFSIAPMLLGFFLMPLWPAYGESIVRGDLSWTKRTLVKSLKVSALVSAVYSLVLMIFGRGIIKAWAGPEVVPTRSLLLGLAIWTIISVSGNAISMFLNGCNKLGFQAITGGLMALAAIAAKVLLAKSIGLSGIIWGTLAAYALFIVIPFGIYLPRILAGMARSHHQSISIGNDS